MANQQPIQLHQQNAIYPFAPVQVNPHAYPVQPQQLYHQNVVQPSQEQPIVRGRVHDSFMKPASIPSNSL